MLWTSTNTTTSTFSQDLASAHEIENKLANQFRNNCDCTVTTSQEFGAFPDWDLKVHFDEQNIDLTVEVKNDKKAVITGNIAVEFQRTMKDGTVKPTCISVSKADLFAYYFDNQFYIIGTKKLRTIIKKQKYFYTANNAGDGERSSVYLFTKDVFKKYATPLNNLI
ncbi:MAG: hypothetical protein M3Z26_00470 [Bacteroidota bacterium]|nr:hypothetical protein [Bacteroidota bacterium]